MNGSSSTDDASKAVPKLAPIFAVRTTSKRVREGDKDETSSSMSVDEVIAAAAAAAAAAATSTITTTTSDAAQIDALATGDSASNNKRTRVEEVTTTTVQPLVASTSRSSAIDTPTSATKTTTVRVTETMQSPKLLLKWLQSDPAQLLHGLFGPPHFASKLACFDIDGTLISTSSGARFPKSPQDWKFWCGKGNVEDRLKEYHAKGYSIVFVSNQNYAPHTKSHQNFKSKIPLIGKSLGSVPFRVLAATAKDCYRKPSPGIWKLLEKTYDAEGFTLDKRASFYVGDAAGRPSRSVNVPLPNGKTVKRPFERDHSDSDKVWAQNVGIKFYTPEEFFWDRKDEVDGPSTSSSIAAL